VRVREEGGCILDVRVREEGGCNVSCGQDPIKAIMLHAARGGLSWLLQRSSSSRAADSGTNRRSDTEVVSLCGISGVANVHLIAPDHTIL
jgi:hypothetical protein